MGKFAFALAFSNLLMLLGDTYNLKWLFFFGMILTLCLVLYVVIYFNRSKEIKK